MEQGSHQVKSRVDGKNVVVGSASFDIFDTTGEAIGKFGEAKCVQLINSQTRTDEMNKVRALANPKGVSQKALREKATADLITNDMDRLVACAGDQAAIEEVIKARMDELKEEMLAGVGAAEVEEEALEDADAAV